MSEDISRRDAIKVITGVVGGTVFAMAMGNAMAVFGGTGDSEGHSGDHGSDSQGTDTGEGGHGHTYVWFDRGGFTGTDTPPKQGWDTASARYFVDTVMLNHMRNVVKAKNSEGGLVTKIRTNWDTHWKLDGEFMDDRSYYFAVAEDALEKCRKRAQKRANKLGTEYSGKARVVGAGWTWQTDNSAQTWWQFTGLKKPFTTLIPKAGTKDQLHTDGDEDYWSKVVDDPDYPKTSWRKFVYNRAKDGLTGEYSLIVIAVADSEPGELYGQFKFTKTVDSPDAADRDKAFNFKVTYTGKGAPAAESFTLKHGQSFSKDLSDKIPLGVTVTFTETANSLFEPKWTPTSRKIVLSDSDEVTVTCVNTRKVGKIAVKKVIDGSGDENTKFDFTCVIKRPDGTTFKTVNFKLSQSDGTYVIDDIPSTYKYTLTEHVPSNFEVTIDKPTGTIVAGATTSVIAKNTPHGYLQLTKDVVE